MAMRTAGAAPTAAGRSGGQASATAASSRSRERRRHMAGFRRGIGFGPRAAAAMNLARPAALAIIALWVLLAGAPAAASSVALAAQGPAGCPVDVNACQQARRIAGQLLAGDFDGLLANAATRDYVCDGSDGRIGLGGPFPLCDGGAAGEHRQGYPWGHLGSEGSVYSAAQYVAALRTRSEEHTSEL